MTPTQQIIEALGDCVHVEEVGTCTEVTLRVELDELEDHDTNPAMLAYHLRRLAGDIAIEFTTSSWARVTPAFDPAP